MAPRAAWELGAGTAAWGREPAPAATGGQPWGERWLLSSCPHSVPALGSLKKNSLFSFSIQGPERGTCGLVDGGGRKRGWSSLPLFLSCLSSPLAPDLCRLLAAEPEISARMGEGKGGVSPALRLPARRHGGCLGVAAQPPSVHARHAYVGWQIVKAIPLIPVFMSFISYLRTQKSSGLGSLAPSRSPLLCACSGLTLPWEPWRAQRSLFSLVSCLLSLECFSAFLSPVPPRTRSKELDR